MERSDDGCMVAEVLSGPWGQVALAVAGGLALVITLLLLACFLIPGCIGYECVRKRTLETTESPRELYVLPMDEPWRVSPTERRPCRLPRNRPAILFAAINALPAALLRLIARRGRGSSRTESEAKTAALRVKGKENENAKQNDVSYRSWRLGSLYDDGGTISENVVAYRGNSFDPGNARPERIHATSTMNSAPKMKPKPEKNEKEFPTELTMTLQYLPPCDEGIQGKLVVGIEAVSGLPPKQYSYTLEPYVTLNIMKQSWSHRRRQKLHSFQTRGVRHTANPIFKETFIVANVKFHEIKDWILDIAAHDQDRFANHTELCTLKVSLKEVKKILESPEIHVLNYKMKPSNLEFGSILLGISYLPTAQRLTVNVMKARDVKFMPAVSGLSNFNPYVSVLMLNGRTGKKMKKRKTKFLRAVAQPEFNETLIFDLPIGHLNTVQFLVVLSSKVSLNDDCASRPERASDSDDSVNLARRSRDISIGKVALGKGVRGSTERLHWFSVLQNPRKLVTVWHVLK